MRNFRRVKAFFYIHHAKLRTLSAVLLALLIGAGDTVFAQTTDPWANLANLLVTWVTGNLGKFLALMGIIISVIVSIVMHSFKPLAYGVIFSLVVGGLVGLARTFFEAGSAAFGTNW
ncbi:MAG TPA: hypothetical protein EYP20_04075 [Aigarchaeota archaeon]|nr:hypothetical protein [Aigarchaeota archaeon]